MKFLLTFFLCSLASTVFTQRERSHLFQQKGKIDNRSDLVVFDRRNPPPARTFQDAKAGVRVRTTSVRNLQVLESESRGNDLANYDAVLTANSRKTSAGFAACILLRDENHLLTEWLAYHYLTLPLRHLVVSIDPTSMTSPMEILKRWTQDTGDEFQPMDIVFWDQKDYYGGNETEGLSFHNDRQRWFVRKCAQHHKKMNRTWVLLTDPDEFITLNKIEHDDPPFEYKNQKKCWNPEKAEICRKFFHDGMNLTQEEMKRHRPELWTRRNDKISARKFQLPQGLGSAVTTMDVMNKFPWVEDTCVILPRILFTSTDSPKDVILKSDAAAYGLDPMKFRTLRYFVHDGKDSKWAGKALVDVSRTSDRDLSQNPPTIHSPFPNCGYVMPRYDDAGFRIHHYLGSWEEYSYKGDCHRSKEKYKDRSKDVGTNFDLQNWLGDFMDQVGVIKGQYLLQNAGDVPLVEAKSDGCRKVMST